MDTMKQHAKHPKASMALGCCTLCWGILAAFFIFSGGIAVTNLAVEDAYFSAPQHCGTPTNPVHPLSQRCNVFPGSIKKARSFNALAMFISAADEYARLQRNESWELCYGFNENAMKPQFDEDQCSINRLPAPKCGMGEGVKEEWGMFKKYDPNDIGNLLTRQYDATNNKWKNTSVADFLYRPLIYATVGNATFTLQAMFAVLAGVLAIVSALQLTETRKLLLIMMLFTLTTSTYNLYSGTTYAIVQNLRSSFRNCAGLPNATYYKTREIPECRVSTSSKSYVPGSFLSAARYEQYKYRCDLLEKQTDCNRFSTYCSWNSAKVDAQEATQTTRATGEIPQDYCANRLMDGVYSFACNENQLPYWQGANRKCGQFSDQRPGVTVVPGAPASPCDNSDIWDRRNCLQKKDTKCTMNITKMVICSNTTHSKHLPMCMYSQDFVYDLDKVYEYNTASANNHQAVKDVWEPCSEDKTLYGNLTKISDAYFNVPTSCVTDNKGGNEDKLAGSFLARAAVLDWGISMVYAELLFLLLTILHAFYCTGSSDDAAASSPPTANMEIGRAKPNPFGPGQ